MRIFTAFLLSFCLTFAYAFFDASSGEARSKCLPPHQIQAGLDWVKKNYAAADVREPGYVDKFMGENTVISFAPSPPTRGREAIRTFVDWQWGATTSVTHSLEEIFILADVSLIQMTVTYNYTDGVSLTAGAYVAQIKAPEDPFPSEIKIYGDFTAVFAKFVDIAGPPPSV